MENINIITLIDLLNSQLRMYKNGYEIIFDKALEDGTLDNIENQRLLAETQGEYNAIAKLLRMFEGER